MAKKQPDKSPDNAYTRQDLEVFSRSTGVPVEQLWTMPRRRVDQINTEAARRASALAGENQRAEAERQRKLAGEKDEAERLRLEEGRPLTERFPVANTITSGLLMALPFALPFATRRFTGEQKLIKQWEKANEDFRKAEAAARGGRGTLGDAKVAGDRVDEFMTAYNELPKPGVAMKMAKDAGTVAGTTLASTELPVMPALIDSMMQNPGTRAYDEAKPKLTLGALGERLSASAPITAGIAATSLKLGTLANRIPPQAQSRAYTRQAQPGWADDLDVMGRNYQRAAGADVALASEVGPALRAQQDLEAIRRNAGPARSRSASPAQPQPTPRPSWAEEAPDLPPRGAPVENPYAPPGVAQNAPSDGQIVARAAPPTKWEQLWGPIARDVARERARAGQGIGTSEFTRDDLLHEIMKRMAAGQEAPSPSLVSQRLTNLRDDVGVKPSEAALNARFAADPRLRRYGLAAATGGAGYALTPEEAMAALWDEQAPRPTRGPLRSMQALWDE